MRLVLKKFLVVIALAVLFGVQINAAVNISVVKGSNKWGYASQHNICVFPFVEAQEYSLILHLNVAKPDAENPLPRESWFGFYLEDSKQKSKYIAGMSNPSWSKTPENLVPTYVCYKNNGNMQRSLAKVKVAPKGELFLRLQEKSAKLYLSWSYDGKTYSEPFAADVPAGFKPDQVGVTVDCYKAEPVMPVKFESLKIKANGKESSFVFNESEKWNYNGKSKRATYEFSENVVVEKKETKVLSQQNKQFVNVVDEGIINDGSSDISKELEKLFATKSKRLYFPPGQYVISKISIPDGSYLKFEQGAVLVFKNELSLEVKGDDVVIDGAALDLSRIESGYVIKAEKVSKLKFQNLKSVTWSGKDNGNEGYPKAGPSLIRLDQCSDVELSGCRFADMSKVLTCLFSSRVVVKNNKAERCRVMTQFSNGSDYLQHYGNWSRNVRFQCVWWGGDANDTKGRITKDSCRVFQRGVLPDAAEYDKDKAGVYDILIQNNFAEYGMTLCWGAKGKNVVIDGNVARYMLDMAYDTEGGENVVISNNISINSKYFGIGCYFYGERILITGNQVLTLDQGEDNYKGNLVRLHSPGNNQHFGNGQVTISNNQFISEIPGETRSITIEAARNIFIKGNTFNNGCINVSSRADNVTITDCSFETFVNKGNAITISGGGKKHCIKNNTLFYSGKDKGETAINIEGKKGSAIFIDNNIIDGWKQVLASPDVAGNPFLMLTGNRSDGEINLGSGWRTVCKNNIKY